MVSLGGGGTAQIESATPNYENPGSARGLGPPHVGPFKPLPRDPLPVPPPTIPVDAPQDPHLAALLSSRSLQSSPEAQARSRTRTGPGRCLSERHDRTARSLARSLAPRTPNRSGARTSGWTLRGGCQPGCSLAPPPEARSSAGRHWPMRPALPRFDWSELAPAAVNHLLFTLSACESRRAAPSTTPAIGQRRVPPRPFRGCFA